MINWSAFSLGPPPSPDTDASPPYLEALVAMVGPKGSARCGSAAWWYLHARLPAASLEWDENAAAWAIFPIDPIAQPLPNGVVY
jgi:hypothetical protein